MCRTQEEYQMQGQSLAKPEPNHLFKQLWSANLIANRPIRANLWCSSKSCCCSIHGENHVPLRRLIWADQRLWVMVSQKPGVYPGFSWRSIHVSPALSSLSTQRQDMIYDQAIVMLVRYLVCWEPGREVGSDATSSSLSIMDDETAMHWKYS